MEPTMEDAYPTDSSCDESTMNPIEGGTFLGNKPFIQPGKSKEIAVGVVVPGDDTLTKNDGRIVQAVLDLYKRSLEHTLIGDQTGDTRQSFAGSFASLGSSIVLEGEHPACMVSYDGFLVDGVGKKKDDDDSEGRLSPEIVRASQMTKLLDRVVQILENNSSKDKNGADEVIWLHSLNGTSVGMNSPQQKHKRFSTNASNNPSLYHTHTHTHSYSNRSTYRHASGRYANVS
jgi:hypothetical protein